MSSKGKEVATVPKGGALAVPDFMKGMAGMGTENMSAADVEIPRIVLLQALSDPVQEGAERPNTFWHTIAEQGLGAELRIIPVYVTQSFILWRPRKSGGGILARADNAKHWNPPNSTFEVKLDNGKTVVWKTRDTVHESGLDAWGSSDPDDPNSPPAATRMYNIAVLMPDHPELSPAVVTLQRSAIKVARKFVGKIMLAQVPSFGLVFKMTGYKDQNQAGQEFYNFRFTSDGLVTDEATFASAKAMYETFAKTGLKVKDIEGVQDDEAGAEEDKY